MRTVALFVLLSAEALADDLRPEWNVLYGHEEFRKAETMLHDHLAKARAAADQDREKLIGNVRTPAELQKYQAQTAARLQAILVEFPPRTALNAKTVGRLDRSGYAVEKVIFESRPRYYVTANVYVPRSRAVSATDILEKYRALVLK